jgi:hypothetical protein
VPSQTVCAKPQYRNQCPFPTDIMNFKVVMTHTVRESGSARVCSDCSLITENSCRVNYEFRSMVMGLDPVVPEVKL